MWGKQSAFPNHTPYSYLIKVDHSIAKGIFCKWVIVPVVTRGGCRHGTSGVYWLDIVKAVALYRARHRAEVLLLETLWCRLSQTAVRATCVELSLKYHNIYR